MPSDDPFDDLDQQPQQSEPRPFAVAMAELSLVKDWWAAPELTCTVCGNKYRDPYKTGKHTDLCYDCEEAGDKREERKRTMRSLLARIVPPEFEGKTLELKSFNRPPDPAALAEVSSWTWSKQGKGLYLWSRTPGTGKSHMAYAIVQHEILEGRSVVALEWSDLLARYKSTYGRKLPHAETEADVDQAIERADLVLIDDVAGTKPTDWAVDKFWEVVNSRYILKKPLLLTSNYPLLDVGIDLTQALGGSGRRIVSRLEAMCRPVQVGGPDVRGQVGMFPKEP